MKKVILLIAVVTFLMSVQGRALSNDELRVVMDKPVASIGDAVAVVSGIPGAVSVQGLKSEQSLNVGGLAVVMIKAGVLKGGMFYGVTGWDRYAAESLFSRNLIPVGWSWNRKLSGAEMLGVVSRFLPSSEKGE